MSYLVFVNKRLCKLAEVGQGFWRPRVLLAIEKKLLYLRVKSLHAHKYFYIPHANTFKLNQACRHKPTYACITHTHTHGHKHALAYIHAYIHVFKLNRLTYTHTYTCLHTDLNLTARNMKFPKPVLPTFLPIAVIFLDL